MKILVTGANGFIGQRLCETLLKAGYFVRGAIRHLPSGVHSLKSSNNADFVFIDDISQETNWSMALKGIDCIIHLAARVHIMKETSGDTFTVFRKVNAEGTSLLARMAADAGVKRFIFLSTVKVNGEGTEKHQFTERDTPNPHDDYSTSKWEAEQALHNISDSVGLEVVILRPPLVYGPGVKANFLRLLDMVNKNTPLPLSLVNNKRSMIYIGNLVDAIVRCIEHPVIANQTFLVNDGQDVSTPELIRMIARAMGKKARLFPCPVSLLKMIGKVAGKSAEIERLVNSLQIDSTKIRRTLNWIPPFTVEEGILETVKGYKSRVL